MDAINLLSTVTRISTQSFGIAGNKDKRASTTQYCTVYRTHAHKLIGLNSRMKYQQLYVGNYRYVDQPLRLGELNGNRFNIVLRDIQCAQSNNKHDTVQHIIAACESIQNGFVNYYGLQRFGNTNVSTHRIGQSIIQQNYASAVELILVPRTSENTDISTARHLLYTNKNIYAAYNALPHYMSIERSILYKLMCDGCTDYIGALYSIPRTMRLMYVHAWQSYIWNHLASYRVQCGLQPVVGDVVIINDSNHRLPDDDASAIELMDSDEIVDSRYTGTVYILTQSDIDTHQYTIYDIVYTPTIHWICMTTLLSISIVNIN